MWHFADDLEMSESESDHSEGNDDSGSNNTVTNPIKGHTVNMEQENMEEQILGELQETDNEEQEKIHFIRWFSLLRLRIKLHYNLSNNLFTILLNVIYFIFVIFCHPLHISGFQKQLVTLRLFRIWKYSTRQLFLQSALTLNVQLSII